MYNHTGLQGRLTADPELRYTQQGTAITAFLRANPRFRESKITVEPEQAWEKRAYIDAVPYDVILNPANRERFPKALTSGTDFR